MIAAARQRLEIYDYTAWLMRVLEVSPEGTVFRTLVEADAVDAAAIEGLQAMRRELVGPVQKSKLIVEIAAMGPERPS
jgi:hypothetical protein